MLHTERFNLFLLSWWMILNVGQGGPMTVERLQNGDRVKAKFKNCHRNLPNSYKDGSWCKCNWQNTLYGYENPESYECITDASGDGCLLTLSSSTLPIAMVDLSSSSAPEKIGDLTAPTSLHVICKDITGLVGIEYWNAPSWDQVDNKYFSLHGTTLAWTTMKPSLWKPKFEGLLLRVRVKCKGTSLESENCVVFKIQGKRSHPYDIKTVKVPPAVTRTSSFVVASFSSVDTRTSTVPKIASTKLVSSSTITPMLSSSTTAILSTTVAPVLSSSTMTVSRTSKLAQPKPTTITKATSTPHRKSNISPTASFSQNIPKESNKILHSQSTIVIHLTTSSVVRPTGGPDVKQFSGTDDSSSGVIIGTVCGIFAIITLIGILYFCHRRRKIPFYHRSIKATPETKRSFSNGVAGFGIKNHAYGDSLKLGGLNEHTPSNSSTQGDDMDVYECPVDGSGEVYEEQIYDTVADNPLPPHMHSGTYKFPIKKKQELQESPSSSHVSSPIYDEPTEEDRVPAILPPNVRASTYRPPINNNRSSNKPESVGEIYDEPTEDELDTKLPHPSIPSGSYRPPLNRQYQPTEDPTPPPLNQNNLLDDDHVYCIYDNGGIYEAPDDPSFKREALPETSSENVDLNSSPRSDIVYDEPEGTDKKKITPPENIYDEL